MNESKEKPDEFNNFQVALFVLASFSPLIVLMVVLLGYWLELRWLMYVGIVIHLFFVMPGLLYIHVRAKNKKYSASNQQVTLLVVTTTTALFIMVYGSGIWVLAGVIGWCVAWWTLFISPPGRVEVAATREKPYQTVGPVITCPNCGAQLDPGVLANYASIAVGSVKCGGCGHSFSADALRK